MMSDSEYESSSSEEELPFSFHFGFGDPTPNPFYLEDYASLLISVKKLIAETKESSLQMYHYEIGGAEMKSILEALTNSDCKITNLSLGRNNLESGMEGVFEMLAETKVEKLNVDSSNLVNADFMHLMEVLKRTQITELNVGANDIKLDENETNRFTSLLLESRLTHLDFNQNKFEPAICALSFIEALPLTSITSLDFTGCFLDDAVKVSLFSIIHLTCITKLGLCGNDITDVQLKELCVSLKVSKLQELNLCGNYIQDAGMDFLAAGLVDSSLIELNLSSNKFSGNNSFCSCLANTKIQMLDFSDNDITHDKMFSFPRFLKGSSVVSLAIRGCKLEDEVGQELMRNLKLSKLKDLSAEGNQFGALSLLELTKIINYTKLKSIDFSFNSLPYSEFVTFSECLRSSCLESIGIRMHFTDPSSISALSILLRSISDSPVSSVKVFVDNLPITKSIAGILGETKLTHFGTNQSGSDVVKLADHLKFSSLTRLILSHNNINDAGADVLAKCLKETQIINLDLSSNLIASRGAAALAKSLKGSSLLRVDLDRNLIKNDGYLALTEGVKDTFITRLGVKKNPGNRILLVEKVLWENRISKAHLIDFFKKNSSSKYWKALFP